jgi:hypothetical protein
VTFELDVARVVSALVSHNVLTDRAGPSQLREFGHMLIPPPAVGCK